MAARLAVVAFLATSAAVQAAKQATCTWSGRYADQVLYNCVTGDNCKEYGSISTAKAACELLSGCGGIVQKISNAKWELRTDPTPKAYGGFNSYVKGTCKQGIEPGWQKLADGPFSAREGLMGVMTDDGTIVMAGGRDHWGAAAASDVWTSANGSSWTKLADPGFPPRAYHAMMVLKGCIFVMGGQIVSFIGNPFHNDVWKSCDGGNSWVSLGNAPWKTRAGIAFTVYRDEMIVAGGCWHSSIGAGRYFLNDVWASSDGQSWRLLTANASWSPRSGARLVVHNDRLLLIAGEVGFTPTTQKGDVWTSQDGADWSLVTQTPGWTPRSGHGVVVIGSSIYVIAGWVDNKCVHDLWVSSDGANYQMVSNSTWNCNEDSCGKFDFWPLVTSDGSVITMGGSGAYATFGKMWADTWLMSMRGPSQTVDSASFVV